MATLVNISIKGFTEAGHEASFDFTAVSDNVQAEMIDAMNQLWLANVTPNLPGWIQRHDFEVCDTVLLREQENSDGSRTPIVTMYTVKPYLNHKFLHEYLNSVDDVRAFEALTGRPLQGMPLYPGMTSPERGKRQQDAQYFVKVKPFGVLKRIPEAGEGEDAREKHRLVRFIPVGGAQSPAIDASKARADLGGGQQPRVMGRGEQATGESKFVQHMNETPPNPYAGTGKPDAQQSPAPEIAEAIVEKVFVQQNREGVVSYVLQPANVIIYSRDPLRACDVPCEDWQPGRQTHVLANKLRVKYTLDGTVKKMVALEKVAA